MKKHIFGLALFSFIVSAAAVVYAGLSAFFPVRKVDVVACPPSLVSVEGANCKLRVKSKINSFEISQAVFNAQTRRFDLQLDVSEDTGAIALHVFSKNNKGTRYIETIQIGNNSDNGKVEFSNEAFDWLNKSKSSDNFFVVPESITEYRYINSENQPKFDSKKAVAITVDYGK